MNEICVVGDELCVLGNMLWNELTWEENGMTYTDDKYKKYTDHIKECKICQDGLGMTADDIKLVNEFDAHPEQFVPVEIKSEFKRA